MAKENGYLVTIRAFIPAPRDDFDKQATAAQVMGALTKNKALTPEFVQVAEVLDVKGRQGTKPEAGEAE